MKKIKSSSFFTLLSVVLVLCLLGIYGIITLHAGNMADILKENLNLIVELENDSFDLSKIQKEIAVHPKIKSESVHFVSKKTALENMNNELGEDFLLDKLDNPFSDVILFNVKYQYVDTLNLTQIKQEIEAIEGVKLVSYFYSVYNYLQSNVQRLSSLLLIIGIVLGFFAFSLIFSTIQLSMYAERFKIRTMELVGATWSQIRKPFILKSIRLAILASMISIGILIFILGIAAYKFDYFWSVINLFWVSLVFLLMILFAFFITQLASYFVVNRYLGAEKGRFY